MKRNFLVLLAVISFSGLTSYAQVTTGTPPFGSFGGGRDIINPSNLNSHLTIPVLDKPGRGFPFSFFLTYDSSVWFPVTSGSSTSWHAVPNWGWNGSEVKIGFVSSSTNTSVQVIPCGKLQALITTTTFAWVYHDGFATPHPFSPPSSSKYNSCTGTTTSTSVTATAADGSGFTLSVTGGTVNQLVARDGNIINAPVNVNTGAGSVQDRNGNRISLSSSGVFTDTLGTSALTVSGAAPNPVTFTYTAPSGASAAYTQKYTSYTVQTNFGCSGIAEYGATSQSLVSEIDLPDGTKYTFTYEPTPGHAGNVTGRLKSVTLPTSGTISYSYSGGNNGIVCADGSAATLTRTTPDGTWTYAHSESGTAWTSTVTDPQQNQTLLNFQRIYETERRVYQGSTSGTLLQTVNTCYNGNTTNCNTTAITLPITQLNVTILLPGGLECEHIHKYNNFGLETEMDDYAYARGAPGSLIRQTLITYASLSNSIVDRPATVTVKDGSGNIKAQTTYGYDQTVVTATSGTPQHVAVSGSRANPTTASYLVQGSTTLNKTFVYFDTGTVQTARGFNGATTTYTYGACGNSFVTNVSLPLSLSKSFAWNCTGGVMTSSTDENGKVTSYTYNDADFWRPHSATDPASNITNFTYNGATSMESSLLFNSSSSTVDLLVTYDNLGRGHVAQRRQAPGSGTFDSVETDFDALGRSSRATLPYSGSAGQTSSSAPGSTTTYDALGRILQVSDSGGGSTSYSYNQNDVLVTASPAPTGENTKRRQYEYDALRRLTSVCEITTASSGGTCGQTVSATGYWTKYSYDALGNLASVTQNAQSGTTQTRTYVYDDLGRMTSETDPEPGNVTNTYDTDSTCGTSSGDQVKRVDAVGNTTCFAYDALHRLISMTYTGPYAASTPNKYFVYDSATVNSVAMANVKGRMAEAYTATCLTCTKIADTGFSYTVRGEVSDTYESTPHSSGYYHVSASYWANGVLDQLSGLSGLPTISYNVDSEGRVYSASASSGQSPLASTVYNLASEPTLVNLGSSDSDSFGYDPNTDRATQYQFNVNGQSVIGNLTWNANWTLQTLNVTDPFNSADTQNCTYAEDDLARIQTANCGSAWAQTFGYDAFGNISKSGSSSFQPTYSPTTNRMTALPGFTPTYDANGNVNSDSLHTYSWDAAGRPVTIDTISLSYDALDRMVEQNRSGSYSQIVYAPTGEKLALMNGQTLQKALIGLSGGATAVYNASGLAYYRHPDWLGSARFSSTPNRAMYSDVAYAPFGEAYAQAGTTELSFTSQNQDTSGGLYDFPAREYSIQGRWPSPDPGGLLAVDLSYPQTWNRYAYVVNDPMNVIDPLGLCGEYGAAICVVTNYCDTCNLSVGVGGGGNVFGVGSGGGGPQWVASLDAPPPSWERWRSGGCVGPGCASPQTPGWWKTLTALARKVGNYIPVPCGAGAFDYYGGRISGSVASVGLYKINAADTRDGASHGVFTDITVGEAVQGGYGYASYSGGSTEHFLFGGVGGNLFGLGLSGGLYGSHVAGDSIFRNQIGLNGDVGVPGAAAGGGAGINTDSLTSCVDHNFH